MHRARIAGLDPAGPPSGPRCSPGQSEGDIRTRFEREVAALDLTDASQASTLAAILSENGAAEKSRQLAEAAAQHYESADRHRHLADSLDSVAVSVEAGVEG